MQHQTVPQTSDADAQETWFFTFGSGQQHDGKYVVIPGTYDEARDVMLAHFGNAWSFQYGSAERAGVEEFGLVELPRAEWPTPAEAENPDEDDAIAEEIDRAFAEEAPEESEPDYWLSLADDLRTAADRIATLAGTDTRPASVTLNVLGSVLDRDAERMVPLVDALAAAFDTTAAISNERRDQHRAKAEVGAVKFQAYTYVPKPDDPEKAAMRAELDALRAQLAEGGVS